MTANYKISFKYSQEELGHLLIPREDIVYTLVVTDPKNDKKITDFISFYNLPTQILKCKDIQHKHTEMKVSEIDIKHSNFYN